MTVATLHLKTACHDKLESVRGFLGGKMQRLPSSKARFHRWIIEGCTPNRLASSLTVSSSFSASNATSP